MKQIEIKIECEPEEFIELKKALGNAQHDVFIPREIEDETD